MIGLFNIVGTALAIAVALGLLVIGGVCLITMMGEASYGNYSTAARCFVCLVIVLAILIGLARAFIEL